MQRVRSLINRDTPSTVSVSIKTPPADADRVATLIARHLVENLDAVGVDAALEVLPPVELYREVLLNDEFDVFVSRLPPITDPDELRTLLHSVFAEEPGWQNPYNFTSLTADEYFDEQRAATGLDRRDVVKDAIEYVKREQPLSTIAVPDGIRAVRPRRFEGWHRHAPQSALSYLALESARGFDPAEEITLRIGTTDSRVTRNLNPLAAEFRGARTFTRLLYDPLMYRTDGERLPWLATDWEWDRSPETSVRVTLRPELVWHDGTALTASDVAFTYRFLQDTSLGGIETTVPTPVYRGRSTLVEDVVVADERTLTLSFADVPSRVAERTLTVPILPEHVWEDRTDEADIPGITGGNVTDALVWSNGEPVGSGPLAFERSATNEALFLERFEGHFLHRDPPAAFPDRFGDGTAFDRLELRVVPSDEAAVELLAAGELDATTATVTPQVVPEIGQDPGLSLLVDRTTTPYHVGYNTGSKPFSNPHFRRLVSRLLDKRYVAEEILEGYGTPVSNPFEGSEWHPAGTGFDGADPEVPFLGEDGEVDVRRARAAFRDRGFEFDENDNLVVQ